MNALQAAVIVFPGSNGDRDLEEALRRAGFATRMHPANEPLPDGIAVAALPGGFSYGDYWRAGMLASQAPAVMTLRRLVDGGGLVLGVCNGFQILVEAGILPGALRGNTPPGFCHRWVDVTATGAGNSPWFWQIPAGTRLRLPIAHGEGNYYHPEGPDAPRAAVPLVYDVNPNGSMGDAAGLLDSTGQVLGIMPHPERAADIDCGSQDGLQLFTAAHRFLQQAPPST